jgi:hypothetical protein
MSVSQKHPAHDLFDHWWVPGGIQTLVMSEFEKNPEIDINPDLLSTFFESRGCPETSRLVAYIASTPGLLQIGSGSVDVGLLIGLPPTDDFCARQELYIGSVNPRIFALEWLGYLARSFDEIPQPLHIVFDGFCKAIVTMVEAPATPISWDELDPPDERPTLEIPGFD